MTPALHDAALRRRSRGVDAAGRRRYVDDLLVHAIGAGVRAETPSLWVPEELGADLVAAARRRRLTGFVGAAVRDGTLVASSSTVAAVDDAHRRATWRALLLEQQLRAAVDTLAAAGVTARVLKGPAIAGSVYADPLLRTFIDIDLLVTATHTDGAVEALTAAGYRRLHPQLRPGFDRRFAKSVTLVDVLGCQLDLHRTLVVGPHGLLIERDDLFADDGVVTVGGRSLPALAPTQQFLNVCYHAALGDVPPRLVPLRDVAESLRHPSTSLSAVVAMAERWHGRAVVARAINLAATTLGLPKSDAVDWARRYRPSREERRLLICYTSPYRSNAWKYLASMSVLPTAADRLAFVHALLLPESAFVRARAENRRRWWTHGVKTLRGRGPVQGWGDA